MADDLDPRQEVEPAEKQIFTSQQMRESYAILPDRLRAQGLDLDEEGMEEYTRRLWKDRPLPGQETEG